MELFKLLITPFIVCYDGEGDTGAGAGGEAGDAGGDKGAAGGDKGGVEITPELQKIIDQKVAESTKATTEKSRKAMEELEAYKSRSDLTKAQRDDLEKRYDTIQKELLTKEQLFEQEKKKREKESSRQIENLTSERDTWRDRYTDSTIMRAIIDASASNDAFNNNTIAAILRPNTKLIEILDKDGKPTGSFDIKVNFTDPEGKDGKPVDLVLSVPDAVKRMTELTEYQFLFKGKGTGGVGGSNNKGKQLDVKVLAKDPAAYREARKSGNLDI